MARRKAPARGRTRTGSKGARKTAARKTAARKTAARKTAARKTAARKTAARKTAGRKTAARKTAGRKTAGRTRTARASSGRTAARKTAGRKTAAARKTAARKTTARKTARTPAARTAARSTARQGVGRTTSRTRPPRATAPLGRTVRRGMPDEPSGVPSSLDLDRSASAVRTGRRELRQRFADHTETGPAITGGDVDADWESAYSVGDEAPGGDNPTPDQDIVDEIGRAVGVQYDDNEELKGDEKIARRDRHRWELDPASAEDYDER